MRFLIIFTIIVGVLWYFFRDKKHLRKKNDNEETMVDCKVCGIFTSPRDGIIYQNEYYCSKECFQKDKK